MAHNDALSVTQPLEAMSAALIQLYKKKGGEEERREGGEEGDGGGRKGG